VLGHRRLSEKVRLVALDLLGAGSVAAVGGRASVARPSLGLGMHST